MQEFHEKVMLVELAFERLQDDVKHSVRVEVEVANDRHDDLQSFGWRRHGEVLIQFSDQLRIPFALLAKEVELLLLVAVKITLF